jgi:hypothetical protein
MRAEVMGREIESRQGFKKIFLVVWQILLKTVMGESAHAAFPVSYIDRSQGKEETKLICARQHKNN